MGTASYQPPLHLIMLCDWCPFVFLFYFHSPCALKVTCKLFKKIHCVCCLFLFQPNGLTPPGWDDQ